MKILFIRHGAKGAGRDPSLTPEGRGMVAQAAAWIAERGLAPERVLHSKWARTRETAQILVETLGAGEASPLPKGRGVPQSLPRWDELVSELVRAPDALIALVGSHGTQGMIAKHMDGARFGLTRRRYAAVMLLERDEQGRWACVDAWPGVWKAPR